MGHHKVGQDGVDGVSGPGSHGAVRVGGPRWAEGQGIDRALETARTRQAWERLVASCRREAERAVG
jgi:hypothetical protein